MKHTPGPWKVYRDGSPETLYVRVLGSEPFDKEVAVCYTLPNESDANLIAAVPELLESREQLIHEIEQNVLGIASGYSEHLIEKAAAAIRKAKGEE